MPPRRITSPIALLWIAAVAAICVLPTRAAEPKYDLVIKSGRVVDGTGVPWFQADIAVQDGRIAKIGRIAADDARETIDAAGLIVAPGFIDMMGQTATPLLEDPSTAINLLTQGITTINAGEGDSAAPLVEADARRLGWQTMGEYFQMLDLKGLPVNVVQTVGLTKIREIVLGDQDRRPSDEELDRMRGLVREAMDAGAIGVSTALIYPPAVYATTKEIAALAKVAGERGGRYYTHMRNEGDRLLEAIDEAIEIGAEAGTPVHIFHLKAAGEGNWGKLPQAIARIKAARTAGLQIAADVYPYQINGLGLEALIHPRHFASGREQFLKRLDDAELRAEIRQELETTDGWENWYRHVGKDWSRVIIGQCGDARYAKLAGRSIAEIAEELDEDPWESFFNLVQAGSFALPQSMSEANTIRSLQEEFVSFCTDVGPASDSQSVSHPRSFGAFPRLFSRYVRDLGAISLERAVAQASAAAANEVMAYDRGRLAEGLAADVIVFDEKAFRDRATPANPRQQAEGMKHVVVNGVVALRDGKLTGSRPGYVLRGPGFSEDAAPHRVVTGKAGQGLEAINALMQNFLAKHRAPGASLAITDHGRLVYARGFGYADVATREPATAESLFRIASVSKPITAVAIMQLVESGKLKLDDKAFDILDEYEPHLEEDAKVDERQSDITILHLLQHRGGWDRDKSFDAMFQSERFAQAVGEPAPASQAAIIRCMLGLPLDFAPGERYAYSNYGYCLLGRVIEKLTGQSYEDYVKQHVLQPIGATRMAIGATHLSGRREGEVRYYDTNVETSVHADTVGQRCPPPYGAWYLESMDSHGAWIASAVDLVRFAAALDDEDNSPLLKAESIKAMFERPPGLAGHDKDGKGLKVCYGVGWQVQHGGDGELTMQMHGGSLPGTSTKLVRRSDGRNFAVLFNARETALTGRLAEDISGELNRAISEVDAWPDADYFAD